MRSVRPSVRSFVRPSVRPSRGSDFALLHYNYTMSQGYIPQAGDLRVNALVLFKYCINILCFTGTLNEAFSNC